MKLRRLLIFSLLFVLFTFIACTPVIKEEKKLEVPSIEYDSTWVKKMVPILLSCPDVDILKEDGINIYTLEKTILVRNMEGQVGAILDYHISYVKTDCANSFQIMLTITNPTGEYFHMVSAMGDGTVTEALYTVNKELHPPFTMIPYLIDFTFKMFKHEYKLCPTGV